MRWFELIFYLGLQIWKKKKISIRYEYHHKKVKDADKKAYTKQMGKAMLVIGTEVMTVDLSAKSSFHVHIK